MRMSTSRFVSGACRGRAFIAGLSHAWRSIQAIERVELLEGDDLDFRRIAPLAHARLLRKAPWPLPGRCRVFRPAAFGEGQREVAEALRLLGPELEPRGAGSTIGPVEFAGLLQPPGEDAQQRRFLQLQLGQVRQDAQAEGLVAFAAGINPRSRGRTPGSRNISCAGPDRPCSGPLCRRLERLRYGVSGSHALIVTSRGGSLNRVLFRDASWLRSSRELHADAYVALYPPPLPWRRHGDLSIPWRFRFSVILCSRPRARVDCVYAGSSLRPA